MRRQARMVASRALVLVPFAVLILQAAAWVRHGIDVPYYDDWRKYLEGRATSFDPAFLFGPVNGTVTATGRALDSLVGVLLAGDVVVYQLASMLATLGLLLIVQWRLLRQGLGDRLLAATAFLLTLLVMRARTLWGGAENAFQQGLPIVLILCALALIVAPARGGPIVAMAVFGLGLAGGLSYISGTFAAAAVGMVVLVAAIVVRSARDSRAIVGGISLLAAGTCRWSSSSCRSSAPVEGWAI